jgi:hypothetical protein
MTDKGKVEDIEIRQFISAYCHEDVTTQQEMYNELRYLQTLAVTMERKRILDAIEKYEDDNYFLKPSEQTDITNDIKKIVKGG